MLDYALDQTLIITEGASREVAMLEKISEILGQDGEQVTDEQALTQIITALQFNKFI